MKRHKEGHIPRCFTTFSFAVVDIRWLKVDRNIIKCYSELRKMRLNSNWIPLYSIDIFDKYVPNTVVKEDIRELTAKTLRVIAVYRKDLTAPIYEELTYKAKKIDFSTIDFPERFGYLKLQTT